jgi:type IV secretory pathway ATPase VirB11/archaellum biosynthesis ATPase
VRPFDLFRDTDAGADAGCRCETRFVAPSGAVDEERTDLVVEAEECPGGGDLADPDCRATVVGALADRDADAVLTRAGGRERRYAGRGVALLLAAGRFVDRAAFHDERIAARARRDPIAAGRTAAGRADVVADIAAETGLAACAAETAGYASALRPRVGPTFSRARLAVDPPPDAELRDRRTLDTGAVVRRYRTADGDRYHLTPVESRLDPAAMATLTAAHERLASGSVDGGERAPGRAVRAVADDDAPVERLEAVLRKHTRGHGVFADLFADPQVTDAFATAPADAEPIRVLVDGDRLRTNAWVTRDGAARVASRLRATTGRAFSRASPTVDAVLDVAGRRVRVAGVTDPASDGPGFALRSHRREAWTLPALVANGTLTDGAAGLLSTAVERAATGLVAGTRGAGKTTLLGALLWELPATTRTVVIEDTPELPVDRLADAGRDVQPLRTEVGRGDGPAVSPPEALRTALRLGEGALIVGEVRGEEARTLYEAMRVGASGSAVLGTIHGDGTAAVRERLVTDLGVPESSFGATDLVVVLSAPPERRVASIEEVRETEEGTAFETLYRREASGLASTGTIDRGESRLVASLAGPDEAYADVRDAIERRAETLGRLAAHGRTDPGERDTRDRSEGCP